MAPVCNGEHICVPRGKDSLTRIVVNTKSCAGCPTSNVEQGLQLHLVGRFGAECSTASLDNSDEQDYKQNHEAVFNGTILGGSDDHGLGGCNNVKIKISDTRLSLQFCP